MSLWQKPDSEPTTAPTFGAIQNTNPIKEKRVTNDCVANIGQSVRLKGELTGNEDLTVDGHIEGKIDLKDHHLTIGPNGHITADVHAKVVVVNGAVIGNIIADDKVEIAPSGSVEGDICAPRVALADGSSFKGSIDMGNHANTSRGSGASTARQEVAMSASASD